jgi:hypothetical protein
MKATIAKCYVREVFGQLSEIVNARQEIAIGKKEYGIDWKFSEVDIEEFKTMLLEDNKVYAVETISGKIKEVDQNDIGKFTNL